MDVLSDAVSVMRVGRPGSSLLRVAAPFGGRFPASGGIGFHVVLYGSCWFFQGGAEPLELTAGDVVLVPHGSAHGVSSTPAPPRAGELVDEGDGDIALLSGVYPLDRTGAHPLLAGLPDVVRLPAHVLRVMVGLIADELRENRPGADALVPMLLDALLVGALRAWYARQPETGWAAALADPAVASALRALHAEPGRQWTVEALAEPGGLPPSEFAKRFASLIGRAPMGYLTWWRMTLAARLLRAGEADCDTVARRVGYPSELAFARVFARELGSKPSAFQPGH